MTKSRWAHWSRGTEDRVGFKSFMEAMDTGNPTGTGNVSPAERARQLGLQSDGSGGYIDPDSGQVVARTVNNELVFYDNRGATGGVVSDGAGGEQLANAQPSWSDPKTGMLTTPPAQPESPEELAAVPDATPAVAPMGYNDFMKKKKEQAYANPEPEEQEQPAEMGGGIPQMSGEIGGDMGLGDAGGMMGEDYDNASLRKRDTPEVAPQKTFADMRSQLNTPQPQAQQSKPTVQQVKKQPEVAVERPPMPQQPTADEEREMYDWATETRGATMKSLQEKYAGTAKEKQNIDRAITSRYEPLQKLLSGIEDPDVRDRQAKAFVNAMSTRHRNNNGTNAMTAAQYEGLQNNREKLQGLDFDEDGNHDFDRIRNFKNDMIIHDDISDDYVMSTYNLLPDHVRGSLTHTSRKKLSSKELDKLQEKYPLAKRMKDYMDYSPVFWKQYLQTGGIDAYTGQHLDINDLNIEHILPGVSGNAAGKGSDLYEWTEDPDNKVLVHRAPNQLKGDRALKDFLDRQLADYDPNQSDLYDFRADADEGAQGAKMKTRSFDIENLANLLLDFGPDGNQEGVYKEDITPEQYDEIIEGHKKHYEELKGPILKAFHDKFDPEDLGYHKLTPKKLEARLKEEGKEDQLGRYMMMRDVFNQVNGLKPNLGQINKNMKIGKKTLPANPRTDPDHGGQPTGSSKTREAMTDAFTKSFLGKDRSTQEEMKRMWNDAVTAGSGASASVYNDAVSEPDFYRRKEKTQFAGLQAFHRKLQDSGVLDDGVLDREEFAALKKDMAYHRDTNFEDHMKIFDLAEKDSKGRAKPNWFNKYLDGLMKESFDFDEDEDETLEDSSMDGLLRALSRLMRSSGEVMSESSMSFSNFMSVGSSFLREDEEYLAKAVPAALNQLRDRQKLPKGMKIGGANAQGSLQPDLKKGLQDQGFGVESGKLRAPKQWGGSIHPDLVADENFGNPKKKQGLVDTDTKALMDKITQNMSANQSELFQDLGMSEAVASRRDWAKRDANGEVQDYEQNPTPFLSPEKSSFYKDRWTSGETALSSKESLTIHAAKMLMQQGRMLQNEELADFGKQILQRYGAVGKKDAKAEQLLAGSTQAQMQALSKWLDEKGIDEESRKLYKFARAGGSDNDIDEDESTSFVDNFNKDFMEFLGPEYERIFESNDVNAFNPTDAYMVRGDKEEDLTNAYRKIFETYGQSDDPQVKKTGMQLALALMREASQTGDLISMSLKDTAGYDAKATPVNHHALSDKGIQALAASVLKPGKMKLSLNNFTSTDDIEEEDDEESSGGRKKKTGINFGSSDLDIPVSLQMQADYLDADPEDIGVHGFYRMQESNKTDVPSWEKHKLEPKAMMKRDDGSITDAPEKFGIFPAQMIASQIERLTGVEPGLGWQHMGVKPVRPDQPMTPAGKPKGGKVKEKYERDLADFENNRNLKYEWDDFNLDEDDENNDVAHFANMLNYIAENNNDDFSMDLSSTNIGDKRYGIGEGYDGDYNDFIRGALRLGNAVPTLKKDGNKWKPGKMADLDTLTELLGDGIDPDSAISNRFSNKLRLMLNRIRTAHGLMNTNKEKGNQALAAELAQALTAGSKMATDPNRPIFPYLKLSTNPKMNESLDNTYLLVLE